MIQPEFHYRIPWAASGPRPGAHLGRGAGLGQNFRRWASLLDHPDPRRLDLRASFTDPRREFKVRLYQPRLSVPVYALLDLSGSMAHRGVHPKLEVLADFLACLARSCHRSGDALGVMGAGERIYPEFCLPLARSPGEVHRLAARLRRTEPPGIGCRGLVLAAHRLPARRALVFLLSDFHLPLPALRELMAGLMPHDVVPVVLWDRTETLPGRSGLARLSDLEGGGERLLLLRPALRDRLEENSRRRRAQLLTLFRQCGREPLFLPDGFDADRVTRYFLGAA